MVDVTLLLGAAALVAVLHVLEAAYVARDAADDEDRRRWIAIVAVTGIFGLYAYRRRDAADG